MKKHIIIATAALLVVGTSAFGQGFVALSGGLNASTRISTNSSVGGPVAGYTSTTAGLYYYALFASATQTTVNGTSAAVSGLSSSYVFNNLTGWTLVGFGNNTSGAGKFTALTQGTTDANQAALNADGSLTVSGIKGGNTANFVMVGWLSTGGPGTTLASLTSWYAAGANSGQIGQSGVATGLILGDGGVNGTPNPFGVGAGQVPGFLLGDTPPVPEPTTLALAALGFGSLLALRRKK